MGFFQTISNKKKSASADSSKCNDTTIQPSPLIYQELNIRIGLLHAHCNTSFSFDTARCNLLFYDWYTQKIKDSKKK